ncbi:MAG TPA: hypothetical protein PLZ77_04265 [Lachnospiraceae bacterium]|nr:hypothetical protein [Lachnospiraceae bacterium]HPF29306.1 hypothetical protein [Lachnospiraceae bacterium]
MEEKKTNEEIEQLTLETFTSMADYLPRLIPTLETLIHELREDMQEDTMELLDMAVNGINWVIEAYNATSEIVNRNSLRVDTVQMDQKVKEFGDAYQTKDYAKIADDLENMVIPFLKIMLEVAEEQSR